MKTRDNAPYMGAKSRMFEQAYENYKMNTKPKNMRVNHHMMIGLSMASIHETDGSLPSTFTDKWGYVWNLHTATGYVREIDKLFIPNMICYNHEQHSYEANKVRRKLTEEGRLPASWATRPPQPPPRPPPPWLIAKHKPPPPWLIAKYKPTTQPPPPPPPPPVPSS